jgi:hypothetical protein
VKRDALESILQKAGVDPGLYSLYGPASDSESYSIVEHGNKWKVLYKERGEFSEIQSGLTEEDACKLVLHLFATAGAWPNLLALDAST